MLSPSSADQTQAPGPSKILQPPSQLPSSLTSSTVLSKSLTKPPALSSLLKPSVNVPSKSPSQSNRATPTLTAPMPQSFLQMPKNVLSNPPPSAAIRTVGSNPNFNSQKSEFDNLTNLKNVSLSNNSSVGSELNNLQYNTQNGQTNKQVNSFFNNSMPSQTINNNNNNNANSQEAFINNSMNKSNSNSSSSINQSFNSSASAQNSFSQMNNPSSTSNFFQQQQQNYQNFSNISLNQEETKAQEMVNKQHQESSSPFNQLNQEDKNKSVSPAQLFPPQQELNKQSISPLPFGNQQIIQPPMPPQQQQPQMTQQQPQMTQQQPQMTQQQPQMTQQQPQMQPWQQQQQQMAPQQHMPPQQFQQPQPQPPRPMTQPRVPMHPISAEQMRYTPTQNQQPFPYTQSNGQPLMANNQQQGPPAPTPPPTYNQPSYSQNIPNTQTQHANQPFNNNTLVRGPPTAADINQKVRQTSQPNYQRTEPIENQFNNMNLNSSQKFNNQPQTNQNNNNYNRQASSGQQLLNHSGNSRSFNNNNKRSQPLSVDLMREKKLIGEYSDLDDPIRPQFPHEFYTNVNCHPDTIRCTLTAIPESQNLLSKCRLPLGILIHPFKDLESLKVVQSSTIVRCRSCRSYINPFVHFIDNTKWRCNLCYSINDLPDEFLFDPVTRSYGDPSKRPEINSSTIEFIAPAEYTLRPPPPAMYLYLLDVSHNAITTGYLQSFCETMLENLDKIPGDSRTQIGFITYNSSLHFYNLSDSLSQPKMMIYPDLEDLILPLPDSLMVNLNENKDSIIMFLQSLPSMFADTYETDSALGTALNAGFQLLKQTGGRMTIMQTCLPNSGVGSLKSRDGNVDKDPANFAPQTDFYKKLALDCAGVHIAVDLFMFNSQYSDLATLSCVSKYSGGEIKYYPEYHLENHPEQVIRFSVDLKRYLVRKIGFEAVMRIRCTRGLTIHTFHGNFFVRSTDLLALPNVNPDAGFGMQIAIEEALTDTPTVCFQAAVLYTSSKGERRIRIHTYCLPVSKNVNELINSADQECIIGLVSKMAVDRTTMSSLKEARDAMINVAIDYLQAYTQVVVSGNKSNSLISPNTLKLIPVYVLALMKNLAFRFGNLKIDDRVYQMNLMKTMPLKYLMLCIYPHLFAIHNLDDRKVIIDAQETEICLPPRLQLSSENIDRHGVYIMDAGEAIYMWIGRSVSDQFLQLVFDCKSFQELPDHSNDLPELDNELSERVRNFLVYLYDSRPFGPTFIYFREDSKKSTLFFQHMIEDKTESSVSYYEFIRHLQDQISS